MNKKINIKKISAIVVGIYVVVGILLNVIGGDQFRFNKSNNSISYTNGNSTVGPILKDSLIEQDFSVNSDIIKKISVRITTNGRTNAGHFKMNLIDKVDNSLLCSEEIDVSNLKDYSDLYLNLTDKIEGVRGKKLTISITSDIDNQDNSPTIYTMDKVEGLPLYIDGKSTDKTLLFSVECLEKSKFQEYYWYGFFIGLLIICGYIINMNYKYKRGLKSTGINMLNTYYKYKFLLHQLIERDFKTKYKRSVLGVMWSFFNPLLTMMVQYVVFSTIFNNDIPNFPVYLLIGVVFFNFLTESCGIGIMSIVGNASLITKVYVPKYIYPVSRVFSSVINLLLSLIPLLIVMILTKTKFTLSVLLIAFGILCIIIFCIGMVLILSTSMVFFRDTQFLWNVISLLWMYATPVFYPETIIPSKFIFVLKLNPMYYFIKFVRIAILDGISPEPKLYLICLLYSIFVLSIGIFVFKKNQDKFVLNI